MEEAGLDRLELPAGALAAATKPLQEAATLPAEAFTSASIYELEHRRLFAGSWLCAGRLDQVPKVGDYLCLDLLDEKLLMVRGQDDAVRVLSRICRHRAAELAQGGGNTRSFQCPYHAWTYDLDGALRGAPFMEGTTNFDRADCRLPEVRSETWEGWLFVNLDGEARPLGPQLAPLSEQLAPYRMSEMVAVEAATFESPFNWKVLTDNFMEAYHHIATHRTTFEPMFAARNSYVPENAGPYSVLCMPGGDASEIGDDVASRQSSLVAATVFPFHLFAPQEGSLTWYQLFPQRHDHFTLRIFNCFPREVIDDPSRSAEISGLQELIKVVHGEDIGACEAVWSGLKTPSFDSGSLCSLEKSIWQFNQWWIERMT